MPRFVILRHTLPADASRDDHYDLMLEDNGELLTWALPRLPSSEPQTANELPPHRLAFLTYQGPVSQNRGNVSRVVHGDFTWLRRDSVDLCVQLESSQLTGQLNLRKKQGQQWFVWLTAKT